MGEGGWGGGFGIPWHKEKGSYFVFDFNTILTRLNPFPNKPWLLRVCSPRPLKTLWEKEKLLVTSNFSFYHSVFYLF